MKLMNTSIDISIIIVNWNTKDFLMECLNSLEECSSVYKKEVIVVDNGSSDGSLEAVRVTFPEAQVIQNNANLGFAKANNIGIAKSRGRYVCLVNSDVKVMDNCINRLITYMDTNPNIGVSGPKILNPDLTIQDSCRTFPSLWNNLSQTLGLDKLFRNSPFFSGEHMFHFKHDVVFPVDYLAGCFFMVRRKALDEIGLLDERFFIYQEEVDWCRRFKRAGWDVFFFPEATIIHNHSASSSKDPLRFAAEQIKSKKTYWKKHHSRIAVKIFSLIFLIYHGLRIVSYSIFYIIAPLERIQSLQRLSKHYFCLKCILSEKYVSDKTSVA